MTQAEIKKIYGWGFTWDILQNYADRNKLYMEDDEKNNVITMLRVIEHLEWLYGNDIHLQDGREMRMSRKADGRRVYSLVGETRPVIGIWGDEVMRARDSAGRMAYLDDVLQGIKKELNIPADAKPINFKRFW